MEYMDKTEKEKGLKDKKKGKEIQYVIELPFVTDSVEIEKKDIISYINGKSQPILGDDFYYSYVYKDGILSFVSFASKKNVAGQIPVIAPALLRKGKFYYNSDGVYYFIENEGGKIKTEVAYDEREGYADITKIEKLSGDIPKTLKLKWSLQAKGDKLFYLGIAMLIISIAYFLDAGIDIKPEVKLTKTLTPAVAVQKASPQGLPDLTRYITDIARDIEGKGYIEKVQVQADNNLQFVIKFKDETYVQSFIARRGGKYENGSIIYTVSLNSK